MTATPLVKAVPNWNGASNPAEGRWAFPFWWEPLALSFILNTDATITGRRIMMDVITLEAGIRFNYHLEDFLGGALVVPASTLRNITLDRERFAPSEDATTQIATGQLPGMPIGPDMIFRLSVLDLQNGDAVTAVRLFYRPLQ